MLLLLFVCLLSGPATDDKHCFDCLLVVSTINLFGPGCTNIMKISKMKRKQIGAGPYNGRSNESKKIKEIVLTHLALAEKVPQY